MKIKYSLNINQLAFQLHFPQLDLVDASIFCFLWDFERAANKLAEIQGQYFEASPGLIIQQLPILGFKSKRAVQKRIGNLVEAGLLERHERTQQKGRTWLRFTEKAPLIYYTAPPNKNSQATNEKSQATNESSYTPEPKFAAPPNESSHDNTTIHNTTKDKEEGAIFENQGQYGKYVQQIVDELKAAFESWGETKHAKDSSKIIRLMIEKDGEDPLEILAVVEWLRKRGPCRRERGQFQIFGFPSFREKYRNTKKGNGGLRNHYLSNLNTGNNGNIFERRGISTEGLFASFGKNE